MDNIGQKIAELRKSKGVTQEALADATGISIQAVSKWENGGSPDVSLLPAIADYFEVPIDTLFGREAGTNYDVRKVVRKYLFDIAKTTQGNLGHLGNTHEMARKWFDICLEVEFLFNNPDLNSPMYTYDEIYAIVRKQCEDVGMEPRRQIRNIVEGSTSYMSFGKSPFYMLIPEPENGWKSALSEIESYSDLFALLSDPATLKAILWICERPLLDENEIKPFTLKGFREKNEFTDEEAQRQLQILLDLKFITQHELELDDTTTIYKPTILQSPILPLLYLADEVLLKSFVGSHRWNSGRASLI